MKTPQLPAAIRLTRRCPLRNTRYALPCGCVGFVIERVKDGRLMVLFPQGGGGDSGELLVLVRDGSEAYEVVR